MSAKKAEAPWAGGRPLCGEVVRGDSHHRPFGCPCNGDPQHGDVHACSCGASWTRDGRAIVVLEQPPFPAICGWGQS